MSRDKVYLLLVYLSMSLLFAVIPEFQEAWLRGALVVAFVMVVVFTYEPLLGAIQQAIGRDESGGELESFSAVLELNKKIHDFLAVDKIMSLVELMLKKQLQAPEVISFIHADFDAENTRPGAAGAQAVATGEPLVQWGGEPAEYEFLTPAYKREVIVLNRVFSRSDAGPVLRVAFEETGASLAIPVIQNNRLLCLFLVKLPNGADNCSSVEYKMLEYLSHQLAIIFDRIRIYRKMMQQTEMDHAEKLQVMQNISSNIAHEMRTPLSGIRANISGVAEYFPELLEAYQCAIEKEPERFSMIREDHLNVLRNTPKRIMLMIDQANAVIDMLLMNLKENSLDNSQMNLCLASECIEQAVDRYPFKSGERELVELDLEENFNFLGIESLFIYVIFNLLKNALYSIRSARKGRIFVRLERGGDRNYVYFRDTGEGIDQEVLERIFEGFYTTKEGGTGAGLAYCRRTIISFNGEIECESVKGEYAEFRIMLPAVTEIS